MKNFFIGINIFILLISKTELLPLKSNIIINNESQNEKVKLFNFFKIEYDWNFDSFNSYKDVSERLIAELNLISNNFNVKMLFADYANQNLNPNDSNKLQIKYIINSNLYTLKLKNVKNLKWIKPDITDFFNEQHDLKLGFNNSINDVAIKLTDKLKKITNDQYSIFIEVNDHNRRLEKLNNTNFIIEFKIKIAYGVLIKKLIIVNIKNTLEDIKKIESFFETIHEVNNLVKENDIKTVLKFINKKINQSISNEIKIELSSNEKKRTIVDYKTLLQVNLKYYGLNLEKNLKLKLIYDDNFILEQLESFFDKEYNWEFNLNSTENDALVRLNDELLKKLGKNIFNYLKLTNLNNTNNKRILLEKNLIKVSINIKVNFWNSIWNNDFVLKLNVINTTYKIINKIKKYCENDHVWYELSIEHNKHDALNLFKNELNKFLGNDEYKKISAINLINGSNQKISKNNNNMNVQFQFQFQVTRNFNITFKIVNSLSQVTFYKISQSFKQIHKLNNVDTLTTFQQAIFAMHLKIFVSILSKIEVKKYKYIKLSNKNQENLLLKPKNNYIKILLKIIDIDIKEFTLSIYV